MKRRMSAGLVVVFALSSLVAAQRSTKPGPGIVKKVFVISGEVRDAGKSLVSDEINKWTVDNADILKDREGAYLTVKCHVDSDKHTIHVLSISPQQVEARTAKPGDSAFRR